MIVQRNLVLAGHHFAFLRTLRCISRFQDFLLSPQLDELFIDVPYGAALDFVFRSVGSVGDPLVQILVRWVCLGRGARKLQHVSIGSINAFNWPTLTHAGEEPGGSSMSKSAASPLTSAPSLSFLS
jgi:hypothetical protein